MKQVLMGASIAGLGLAVYWSFQLPQPQAQATEAQKSAEAYEQFRLVAAAQEEIAVAPSTDLATLGQTPCPDLTKADITVIISTKNDQARADTIQQVIKDNGLNGEFCRESWMSKKDGQQKTRVVWRSARTPSKDDAVRQFGLFSDAGLITPLKMKRID